MEIHLIRHGKTHANEMGLYCGHTNVPLSDSGVKELTQLKEQGIYPAADVFYTSGLLRAGQTMTILYGAVRRKAISDFAEYNFGRFEMKSHDELVNDSDYIAWIRDETGEVACPAGESKLLFERRVLRGYRYIITTARLSGISSILAVIHGGVISCIMKHLFEDTKNRFEWQPAQGRGYTIIDDTEKKGDIIYCRI